VKQANWSFENSFAYCKFLIRVNGALSASINFDEFSLPSGTEMYVYNENGNMITGPITEKENNASKVWGSWVYQGEYLNIEIKTPTSTFKELVLHSNNIAYGYKHIYKTETAGFGTSESCNINVICPLGTGWEAERNSVALILNDNGEVWCSGAMVMNTCNTSRPFFLTANHCFKPKGQPQQNVSAWRFTFQAWSTTCPHPGTNSDGVTYNGSTLRANWAGTDFCLVELNNTPPSNSNINYAGWSRSTNGITQSTIIHHPQGDVMKISRDIEAPVFDNFDGAQCWRLGLDQGATQGGSSGSPYFDQNHRIIGQHFGIDDGNLPVCNRSRKFGGRFDLSWTGGGTNATRLSNWLDPTATNALTTNTTNVSALPNTITPSGNVIGHYTVNGGSTQYSITNDTYQNLYLPRNSWVSIVFNITTQTFPNNTWTFENTTANGLYFTASFMTSPYGYGTVIKNIYLDAGTNCGTIRRTYTFNVTSIGGFGRVAVSPNPANDNLNVTIIKEAISSNDIDKENQNKLTVTGKTNFSISDINTNQVLKRWTFNESKLMNYNLDIRGLKAGVYVLTTERNGETTTTKVIVQ